MRAIELFLIAALGALSAQTDSLVTGLEAFRRGDYASAGREFKASADPRARAFLALTLAATGRCEQGRPGLTAAFQSADADLRRLAGVSLVQCGLAANRVEEAAATVSKLETWYPGDPDVLYQAARVHMRAWNDAIRQLYEKAPSSFRVNQISGEILETQGRFADAAAEYRKAIAKSPSTLNLHFRLGRALLMSSHSAENLDAAQKEFEAELALNPRDAVAEYQLAQVLLARQRPADAAARLDRALGIDPGFPEAMIALGKLRLDQKRSGDAIALLAKAVALVPRSEAARYNLMMAYRNAGRLEDARREKAELDKLQQAPEGEFTDFLKKLGEKPAEK